MLGLTCDPVCGLVEVPCIKRNSAGAVNAAVSAQMAMAGIKSAIPADEVVDSMRRIGNALPAALRETSEGGLAVTESARKIAERKLWLVGQEAKTPPSHGGIRGSIPLQATICDTERVGRDVHSFVHI